MKICNDWLSTSNPIGWHLFTNVMGICSVRIVATSFKQRIVYYLPDLSSRISTIHAIANVLIEYQYTACCSCMAFRRRATRYVAGSKSLLVVGCIAIHSGGWLRPSQTGDLGIWIEVRETTFQSLQLSEIGFLSSSFVLRGRRR